MSSPIHHAEDLDAALVYAPPWARKQASLLRQTRAAPRGVPPAQWQRPEFSGNRAMLELQRRLALDPGVVPEPPFAGEQEMWPLALRLCAVAGVAALVAWTVVLLPGARKPAPQGTQAAQAEPAGEGLHEIQAVKAGQEPPALQAAPANTAVVPSNRVKLVHIQAPPGPAATQHGGFTEAAPAAPAERLIVAAVPPAASLAANTARDSEEIAGLVQRGHDLLQSGDLVSARLLLQRAAETGSATAAFELAATYDPLVIKKLGVIGLPPDAARARAWYAAAQLGSADAAERLAILEREP